VEHVPPQSFEGGGPFTGGENAYSSYGAPFNDTQPEPASGRTYVSAD
jgi:hypothetical protein